MTIQIYQRPTPTPEIAQKATEVCRKATNGKTMNDIRRFIYVLLIENATLTAEVNEHRAARGFAPLITYD